MKTIQIFAFLLLSILLPTTALAQAYCTPSSQMACFYGDKIVNVTFAGINHTDNVCDVDAHGIKDFTSTVTPAQVTTGNSYNLSVAVENSSSSGTERVRAWIDFNHNYIFEASESFDLGIGTGNTILSAIISIPVNAVSGTTAMRIMYRRTNALNAEDACHSYGSYRGQLKDYAVTINASVSCTAALSPGNTISTLSAACPGENFTLSLQNTSTGPTYQWQISNDGTAWTNITSATNVTLTTSQNMAHIYRCIVECGGNFGTSNPISITANGPIYLPLPINEGFESWISTCGQTNNTPGSNWNTSPASGNNSFRRDDQGATANWTIPVNGMYAPAFSTGSHSARFHSTEATVNTEGKLDVYLDCSAGVAEKSLKFDYININGQDKLQVLLSTDGGQNFATLGVSLLTSSSWESVSRSFTTNSATVILRFLATSDQQLTDIGIDNVQIKTVTPCNEPSNLTVNNITTVSANLSWQAVMPAPVLGYEYLLSTIPNTPSGNGSITSSTAFNPANLSPFTNYYFFVRSVCGGGQYSNWISIPFLTNEVCTMPDNLQATFLSSTTCDIDWADPVPIPSLGYSYVLSTTNVFPSGNGTHLTESILHLTNLVPSTTYYVFIRSNCSNNTYSGWKMIAIKFSNPTTAGIETNNVLDSRLSVYPNPANENISLNVYDPALIIESANIYSVLGAKIKNLEIAPSMHLLDVSSLPNGTYYLKIKTNQGTKTFPVSIIH